MVEIDERDRVIKLSTNLCLCDNRMKLSQDVQRNEVQYFTLKKRGRSWPLPKYCTMRNRL